MSIQQSQLLQLFASQMRTNQTRASNSQNFNLKQGILRLISERYYREITITTSMLIWGLCILLIVKSLSQILQTHETVIRFLTVFLIYIILGVYSLKCKYKQDRQQSLYGYISAFEDAKCTFTYGILLTYKDKVEIQLGHYFVLYMLWHKYRHLILKYNQYSLQTTLKDSKKQNQVWLGINVFLFLKMLVFKINFLGEQNKLLENVILSFLCVLLCLIIKIKSRKIDLSKRFYQLAFIKLALSRFFSCYFTYVFVASGLTQTTVLILLVLLGLNLCFMLQFRQLSQFLYFAEYQRSLCYQHNSRYQLAVQMKDSTHRIWLIFKNCDTTHKQIEICHLCMNLPADIGFFRCQHFIFCQKCVHKTVKKQSLMRWCCPICKWKMEGFISISYKNQQKIVGSYSTKWIAFAQRLKLVTNYRVVKCG